MSEPKEQIVICSECKEQRPLSEMLKQRPLPDAEGAVEVGCLCPNCGHWTHSYYQTPRLTQWQARINKAAQEFQRISALYKAQRHSPGGATHLFQQAQHAEKLLRGSEKGYAKVLDESNAELRKRFGTKSPTQLIQESIDRAKAIPDEGGEDGD